MIFTERELFLLVICAVTYITLFIVTVQNSRRKILSLQDRLEKIRRMKEEQEASSSQRIAYNKERILELENLLQKIGDENSMLKLELEEKKAHLDYTNKVAMIESEKREQAETVIFGSDVYLRMQNSLNEGRMMDETDWQALSDLVNRVYSGFTEKLYELYNLSSQDYRVSLLIKVRVQPKDIAILTAHSKESVASTRSRLYSKVFGKKGSSKDWDEFILSI
ncbi:MAG: hypothetical protein IKP33_09420 [Prevotella sp.]|nr:hypothetical protein [Prevotella sp.]